MEDTDEHKTIIFSGQRMFINITRTGCGSKCFYCYIQGADEPQDFYSEIYLKQSIMRAIESTRFIKGKEGTLISFCPNTDPFKVYDGSILVCSLLEYILPLGNPIQISTKEIIPSNIINIIKNRMIHQGQVVLFTSISSISNCQHYEPKAPPVTVRVTNFHSCRLANIHSCLYIKPFFPDIAKDKSELIELLNLTHPNAICIGIYYKKSSISDLPYQHPVHELYRSEGVTGELLSFRNYLVSHFREIPIFLNSTCVSSFFVNREPPRPIWREDPNLCVGCRECGKQRCRYE